MLTNKPVRVSRELLVELQLLPLFCAVYGGNSFETKKPDPAGVHRLLQETGVAPAEAMIVGDSDVDIATGRNAGIWTCGVTYGFGNLRPEENPPDLIVDGLLELAKALPAVAAVARE